MSTIAGARNTVDWLTGAWSLIQSQSSSTGIAILDALTGKSKLSDGLSISDGQNFAATIANIQQNLLEGQGVIAGQIALTRVQKAITTATSGSSVNKLI